MPSLLLLKNGIRLCFGNVSGKPTAMTVAENKAITDDKKYKSPWGLYFCVRLLIILLLLPLPPSNFPAVVIPKIIPTLVRLMESAMNEPILFGFDAKTSPTIADTAINVVGKKTALHSFEIDTMIAFVNVIDTTEDEDEETRNDAATIILTTLISRVAPTMTDFRPIESNKLPKMGLKIISKTAPKLAILLRIFVQRSAPN